MDREQAVNVEQIVAFLVFALVGAGTPGPANVLLAATGAQVGVLRGVPCLLGVAIGTGALLFAVALGLGAVFLGRPEFLRTLNWVGGAFLLWLAYRIATAPPDDLDAERKPVGFGVAAALQVGEPQVMACVYERGRHLPLGRVRRCPRTIGDIRASIRGCGFARVQRLARLRLGYAPRSEDATGQSRLQCVDGSAARGLGDPDSCLVQSASGHLRS